MKAFLFREEAEKETDVEDLTVQLDVFDEQKQTDEEQLPSSTDGLDLSNHTDIFAAILKRVSDCSYTGPLHAGYFLIEFTPYLSF